MLPNPLHPQCVEKPAATEQWKSGCSPTGTAHCAKERPEPGDEDKSRSHIRKLHYSLLEKGALSLLYTGFKNSLTLLCTCMDTVFGVTSGGVSASLVLSVFLQGCTPFAISQKQGGWEHRPVVQKGWLVTHKETAGWGKNHILWLGSTVKGLWKVRSGKNLTSGLRGTAITSWFPHM